MESLDRSVSTVATVAVGGQHEMTGIRTPYSADRPWYVHSRSSTSNHRDYRTAGL